MNHELCEICGDEIRAMTFIGTGVCSEIHRKIRDGEIDDPPSVELINAARVKK